MSTQVQPHGESCHAGRAEAVPRLVYLAIVIGVLLAGCRGASVPSPQSGRTQADAFVAAAGAGDAATVRTAISSGIDVDVRDATGRTAVTAAALGQHADVVRLLVDAGADVNLQDENRNNALLVCGETGNVEVLREVLRAEPDLTRTNRFGGTALIPAADRGHVAMVGALLETDIPIDHVNRLGWTALLEAVVLGDGGPAHQQIVKMLVEAGADTRLADRDGVTPLEHARRRDFHEIAMLLE
jgi:ankyrin repeat protein